MTNSIYGQTKAHPNPYYGFLY